MLIAETLDSRAQQLAEYLQDGGMTSVHLKNGMEVVTWLTEAQYETRMP